MSKIKAALPKGMRDFSPEVMIRREYIFDNISAVFRKYGYAPMGTPAMERLEVLTGKYGEEGDRLIFKVLNSGDYLNKADLSDPNLSSGKLTSFISEKALRYDLTVPFARFVVMNQNDLIFPFKRYQIQPVWRAERPQKGRYREFFQCDCDVVGSTSMLHEAELIAIYEEAFSNLGLSEIEILVNNRKILSGMAELIGAGDKVSEMCIAIDKLDKIGKEKVIEELERRGIGQPNAEKLFELLELKGSNEEKLDALAVKFEGNEIGTLGIKELREVFKLNNALWPNTGRVRLDLSLARGLDYYTGTIFEVKMKENGVGSLGGGGRYDNLTGIFGKEGLSGVGISFGADRIYLVMEEKGIFDQVPTNSTDVLLIHFGEKTLTDSLSILALLREADIYSEIYPDPVKIAKQFKYADQKKIPYVLIVGEEELKKGKLKLKDMHTGVEESLSIDLVIDKLRAHL